MDESPERLLLTLAHLRSNGLLALETSGGSAVSVEDISRLEALANGLLGLSLEGIDCIHMGAGPEASHLRLGSLAGLLSEEEAAASQAFLLDLHRRVHAWLVAA